MMTDIVAQGNGLVQQQFGVVAFVPLLPIIWQRSVVRLLVSRRRGQPFGHVVFA